MKSRNILQSFAYALLGCAYVLRSQRNFRIHMAVAVVTVACGFVVSVSLVEAALLTIAIALVLMAELLNTAIEAAVDLAAPHIDPLAKTAKDVSAAAVLVAAANAVVVGVIILGPRLIRLLT